MKKMTYVVVSALLALLMVFAVACQAPAPKAEEPAQEAPSAEEPAAEQPAAEQPAEAGKSVKIGACVMDLTNEYFSETVTGYNQFMSEHPEYEITIVDGKGDVTTQVTAIENFITAGMDCILLNAIDDQAVEDVVKSAIDAGIKVCMYPDEDYVTVSLCNDDFNFGYLLGKEAAKWINEKLGGTANVQITYNFSNTAMVKRVDGINKALEEDCDLSKLNFLEYQDGNSTEQGVTIGENVLAANPDTQVWINTADATGVGLCQAISAAGVDCSNWWVGGVDGDQGALNLIKDEASPYRTTIAYTLRTPDIAYDLITNIVRAAQGETFAAKYYQDVYAVDTTNIADYEKMVPTYEQRFDQFYDYYLKAEGLA